MRLHNTASKSIEELQPQVPGHVSLYTCGPTVYNYLQIGNWATYIRWDILVRTLKVLGYEVNWAMNITDVGHLTDDADEGEDKMEKGARREDKTAWEIAEFFTKDFTKGMQALNISQPNHLLKATDHIAEQIALIERLEKKGYTYTIDDGVYFDTSKFPNYGNMANLKIRALKAGARVEFNQQKRNITDFALWKFTPKGVTRDMQWQSPWGAGFPGWHIECSAMAMQYLGDTLDIHAGGIDHIPVHHTNEIAQSEGATGKPFANIWLHGNFITVEGTKLSKSLGNSYSLQDIYDHGFSADDLRVLFLQSHYRTEADFTWEALEAARNRRHNWLAAADLRWQASDSIGISNNVADYYKTMHDELLSVLADDLNTPVALAVVSRVLLAIEKHGLHPNDTAAFEKLLGFIDSLLGTKLAETKDITAEQKALAAERTKARASKDFARADGLRTLLFDQGIEVSDTAVGSRWMRTNY